MQKQAISEHDLWLFSEGTNYHSYKILGAHFIHEEEKSGVQFAVWAPGVRSVQVIGSFNEWKPGVLYLEHIGNSGIWAGYFPGIRKGDLYKYLIETASGEFLYKADPYAFSAEVRPGTASKITDLGEYQWKDAAWMSRRARTDHFTKPMNIYEVHLGSWRQHPAERKEEQEVPVEAFYSYRELAKTLIPYVKEMGYTHLELLPVMEHPLDASWGYQVTGYFAPTSRYGMPRDLMYFIDCCHRARIGVILDWVPGHFCRDSHGLGRFNGEKLYEGSDQEQWGTYRFDFGRKEVRSFLLSSAVFWLDKYHADGIRVDGVTSMLYLNYGVEDPEKKRTNKYGGDGDLEAISLLREFNKIVGEKYPGTFTVAEESTAWPMVTKPPHEGGLGFHYKWDMGWMNDTLKYCQTDFPWRPGAQSKLTFSMMYAFSENFILPLSHDEVVHGKCSLIGRQPGDYWRQFAGLRLLALYQITHSGGKLNFMGNELGQFIEWRYYSQLDWLLLDYEHHRQHQQFIKALNHVYLQQKSLWQRDFSWDGFKWIDADNQEQSVLSYVRSGENPKDQTVIVINFQTFSHFHFRIGVPGAGKYFEILNSDEERFGGSGKHLNPNECTAERIPSHGQHWSIELTVPPLGGVILKRTGIRGKKPKTAEY